MGNHNKLFKFPISFIVNGNCTVPDDCQCYDNWGGSNCDVGQ